MLYGNDIVNLERVIPDHSSFFRPRHLQSYVYKFSPPFQVFVVDSGAVDTGV
jgi:hypothetical protein